MLRARTGFDSVVLGDGSVLAVGDDFACFPGPALEGSERAERYDPATDTWTEAESLNKPRKTFAMVRLADGRALVIGGLGPEEASYSSTKIFDPATGSWTDGPLLDVARDDPAAATLTEGEVIVASPSFAGETSGTTTLEILDPGADAWSNQKAVRSLAVLSLDALSDGRVMAVASGGGLAISCLRPGRRQVLAVDRSTDGRAPAADRAARWWRCPGIRVPGSRDRAEPVGPRRAARRLDEHVVRGRADVDAP